MCAGIARTLFVVPHASPTGSSRNALFFPLHSLYEKFDSAIRVPLYSVKYNEINSVMTDFIAAVSGAGQQVLLFARVASQGPDRLGRERPACSGFGCGGQDGSIDSRKRGC